MRIDHCSLDIRMPHQFLDSRQIHTGHNQVAGKSVPKRVDFGQVLDSGGDGDSDEFGSEHVVRLASPDYLEDIIVGVRLLRLLPV